LSNYKIAGLSSQLIKKGGQIPQTDDPWGVQGKRLRMKQNSDKQ